MSFSNEGAPASTPAAAPTTDKKSGIGDYFASHYPVAGGLANMVFGGQQPEATAPLPQMPGAAAPTVAPSMVQANAQPKQSDGLAAILKFLGA